ncbi:hypothetical protein SAMN04515658_10119 [Idiomarina zobellii]|nr:hypothetical protein SAMN04515658_10119 [Idiomarina zobellii]
MNGYNQLYDTRKGWLKLHKDSSETAFPALIMTNLVHIFCDHRLN